MNSNQLNRKIDSYIQSMHERGDFNGSVLVAVQGEVILARGYGFANVELNVPNQRETVYRIGSNSKPITAEAILTLAYQGQLRLEEQLTTYLPEFSQWEHISIEQLLTHRSGIPNLVLLPEFPQFSLLPHTVDELIATFSALPLNFEPGTSFEYANSNYILLGKVIEAISGKSYADYVREYVLLPAGMENTMLEDSTTIIANRAVGYEVDPKGSLQRASHIDMSNAHAAGGFLSTIDDLYRLNFAMRSKRWFEQDAGDVSGNMYAHHHQPYGYGWFIPSIPVVFHHGGINGFTSTFVRHLEQNLTVIALSNIVTPNTAALGQKLMDMLME
ncbi:serine hydrolase domain-containing protein [Paenibacillus sp. chi10]|uniref:Serine hydrolase domain-containing protein n=1 Tax=Paenibacillus suaedae TaxID=3077233 RepID=A0AAJ2JVY6_9BACL|nr:serine hydrolase domain-containing protein [Paenibacillus sp. chi10]MDT8977726.1 serine hydrolase domain-containing protein [Paenibacillus sp. chi10]